MSVSDQDIEAALQAWFTREIDRVWRQWHSDDYASGMIPAGATRDEARAIRQKILSGDATQRLGFLQDDYERGDFTAGLCSARAVSTLLAEPLDEGSQQFAVLTKKAMEALGEVEEARQRWASGDVDYTPTLTPSMPPPSPVTATDDREVPTLGELAENYLKHRREEQQTSVKGIGQARSQIAVLLQEFPPDTKVTDFTPRMAGELFGAIRDLPPNYRKHPDLRGLTPTKAAVLARAKGLVKMNGQTINSHASTIRGVFEEAISLKIIKENPFKGLWVKSRRKAGSTRGFTPKELEAILETPVFIGCERFGRPFQPGVFLINDWRFWLPTVAMLTGARINELCQLRREDVVEQDGVHVLHITASDGKRLKTEHSERVIPVHKELIRLGFLTYVSSRPTGGVVGSLFSIPTPLNGDWGAKAGNWFRDKLLTSVLGTARREGLGFHSFRHKMETDMRNGDVRKDVSDRLMGHGVADTAGTYGGYEIAPAIDAISKIRLPTALGSVPPRTS